MLRPLFGRRGVQAGRLGRAPLIPHAYAEGLVTPGACKQGPH